MRTYNKQLQKHIRSRTRICRCFVVESVCLCRFKNDYYAQKKNDNIIIYIQFLPNFISTYSVITKNVNIKFERWMDG